MRSSIKVCARDSPLSRRQVEEVLQELLKKHPSLCFETRYVKTTGDLDKKTSLRTLEKSDFFTKELDDLLLKGECDIAIHSAKDLPDPIPKGIKIMYVTKGLDPCDTLVFRAGESLETLPKGAWIATSSVRREEAVKRLRNDLHFVDIRGTIEERLEQLEQRAVDAIVVAEAALIRLKLNPPRLILRGETAPLQGKLAILGPQKDCCLLEQLFAF